MKRILLLISILTLSIEVLCQYKRVLYINENDIKIKLIPLNSNKYHDASIPLPSTIHELGQRHISHNQKSRNLHNVKAKIRYRYNRRLSNTSIPLPELLPLYQGYGTHFAYIFVGTPPQRQSVIIDTGSHYTAFPCTGCSQCGQHTDAYWDLRNSTTAQVPQCGNQPCTISQSYSEDSSWHAFKVVDKFWVGGLNENSIPGAETYGIDFLFGCQTSETGLFRTQLADGIMGLSPGEETLPSQLQTQGITDNTIFGLCFRIGGGILTLGGVDQRIHSKPGIQYIKMTTAKGMYNINIIDIFLQDQLEGTKMPLGESPESYNDGKGVLIDSGTTDSFLPSSIEAKFGTLFQQITGKEFTSANIALTPSELSKMPNIIFVVEGLDENPVEIVFPWSNYIDSVGDEKYAFRLYFTEGSGTILGANFMNGYNIIFDPNKNRIGIAKSNCKHEDFAIPVTSTPTMNPTILSIPTFPTTQLAPTESPESNNNGNQNCISELLPIDQCTARCDQSSKAYTAVGMQTYADKCGKQLAGSGARSCHQACVAWRPVRGNPNCPYEEWSDCEHGCIQSRRIPLMADNSSVFGTTATACGGYTQQTRTCYSGTCAIQEGDYLIFLDLKLKVAPVQWTYFHSETFYTALSEIFNIRESNIELLNNAGFDYNRGVKLHFQLRLKSKEFLSTEELTQAAQNIPSTVLKPNFPSLLLETLNRVSSKVDDVDYSRFGWMVDKNIEILNAISLPYGSVRDPIEIPNESIIDKTIENNFDLFLSGCAIGSFLMFLCVLCCHFKLRKEYADLAKEKISNGSLMMIHRLKKLTGKQENKPPDYTYSKLQTIEEELGNDSNEEI
jgi:hypothetical protein